MHLVVRKRLSMLVCKSPQLLRAYLDGTLEKSELEQLESHLDHCDACCIELSRIAGERNGDDTARSSAKDNQTTSEPEAIDAAGKQPPARINSPAYRFWNGDARFASKLNRTSVVPTQIGRYRVEKLIGSGAFGRVFLAEDEKLERKVAIKVPHATTSASQRFVELVVAEARTVAHLDHPHIVPIYDVGSTEEYPFFLVSKLIDGPNLAQRMSGNVNTADAVRWTLQIAEAIAYAHQRGVIHRDIKPHNILLEKNGAACLSDFGLAWRPAYGNSEHPAAGTPAYMSPEQRDKRPEIDHRTDIYSLGRVLIELLLHCTSRLSQTNQPSASSLEPSLESSLASSVVAAAHSSTEPFSSRRNLVTEQRDPVAYDLQLLAESKLPEALLSICARAVASSPDKRFGSADQMALSLRHFAVANGWLTMPPSAMRVDLAYRTRQAQQFVRSHWLLVLSACLLVGLLIAGAIYRSSLLREQQELLAVETYLEAPAAELTVRLTSLSNLGESARTKLEDASASSDIARALRARLALVSYRKELLFEVADGMVRADTDLAYAISKALVPYKDELKSRMQGFLNDQAQSPSVRLQAAGFLAQAFGKDPMWNDGLIGLTLAQLLTKDLGINRNAHVNALAPLKQPIVAAIRELFGGPEFKVSGEDVPYFEVWNRFVAYDVPGMLELLVESPLEMFDSILAQINPNPFVLKYLRDKFHQLPGDPDHPMAARVHRNRFLAALALYRFGAPEEFWSIFQHTQEPDIETISIYLTEKHKPLVFTLYERLLSERLLDARTKMPTSFHERLYSNEFSQRRLLIQTWFRSPNRFELKEADPANTEKLRQIVLHEADSGMHAVAYWILRGFTPVSDWSDRPWLPTEQITSERKTWSLNSQGTIMVHIEDAPESSHAFSMSSYEITRQQFQAFVKDTDYKWKDGPIDGQFEREPVVEYLPQGYVSWYDAAAYCNWLSRREGLQECYEPNQDGEYAAGMAIKPDALTRSGYRLPIASEWQICCLAGAKTRFATGRLERYIVSYAWFTKAMPVGSLSPNALGFFDMHGNVAEWMLDDPNATEFAFSIDDNTPRVSCGGSFPARMKEAAVGEYDSTPPHIRRDNIGFRIARTLNTNPSAAGN